MKIGSASVNLDIEPKNLCLQRPGLLDSNLPRKLGDKLLKMRNCLYDLYH